MNCCVVPSAKVGVVGVIAIDTSVAVVTVTEEVETDCPPKDAITCADPGARPTATPVFETVTTLGLLLLNVALLVTLLLVPSEYCAVTVNCWLVPLANEG